MVPIPITVKRGQEKDDLKGSRIDFMCLVPPLFRWVSASATGIFPTEPLDSVNYLLFNVMRALTVLVTLVPSANQVAEGHVFTGVCHSVRGRGHVSSDDYQVSLAEGGYVSSDDHQVSLEEGWHVSSDGHQVSLTGVDMSWGWGGMSRGKWGWGWVCHWTWNTHPLPYPTGTAT